LFHDEPAPPQPTKPQWRRNRSWPLSGIRREKGCVDEHSQFTLIGLQSHGV
jgi:hypothetical protein